MFPILTVINTFNDHHIRIVTIGADNEVTELAQSKFKYRTDEGSKGRLWIDYCGDGLLKVFIDRDDRDGVAKPGLPQLTTAFNLATFFGPATDDEDKFFVGFTSSTGTLPSDNHDVLSWYMRQTC